MRLLFLALTVSLSGCAAGHTMVQKLSEPPPPGDLSEPNYRKIIAENIAGIFPDPAPLGTMEISGAWRTDHLKGSVWLTCLRIHAESAPQEYAIFIQEGKIVDQRTGVIMDRCKQQTYQSFEPSNFILQKKTDRQACRLCSAIPALRGLDHHTNA